jgi:NADH:ubiquinone oxidoreductase subunit 5 (subunit L)/multisubunit Na+/H+ antiporter MnhA subunit
VKYTATFVMLIGLAIAWHNYIRRPEAASAFVATSRACTASSPTNGISTSCTTGFSSARRSGSAACFWHGGDEGTIDRFGPHGAAYAVGIGNRFTTRLQSGYLYSYAFVMLLGLMLGNLVAAVTGVGFFLPLAATWAIWWGHPAPSEGSPGGRNMTGLPLLSILIALPLVAGMACLFVGAAAARWIALVTTLAALALGMWMWLEFVPGGPQWQFVERVVLADSGRRRARLGARHRRHRLDADRCSPCS